jgi:ADP-heptose:LPS heptosyltransferase
MKFENAQNIAVVRTDKLGDMVLTLPLVKAIKSNFPDKAVSVIAQSYSSPCSKIRNTLINATILMNSSMV